MNQTGLNLPTQKLMIATGNDCRGSIKVQVHYSARLLFYTSPPSSAPGRPCPGCYCPDHLAGGDFLGGNGSPSIAAPGLEEP